MEKNMDKLFFNIGIFHGVVKAYWRCGHCQFKKRNHRSPQVMEERLEFAYQQMAKDERRESEALEWAEATILREDYRKQT